MKQDKNFWMIALHDPETKETIGRGMPFFTEEEFSKAMKDYNDKGWSFRAWKVETNLLYRLDAGRPQPETDHE